MHSYQGSGQSVCGCSVVPTLGGFPLIMPKLGEFPLILLILGGLCAALLVV